MTDIVTLLKGIATGEYEDLTVGLDAAEEIERLRAKVKELELRSKPNWKEIANVLLQGKPENVQMALEFLLTIWDKDKELILNKIAAGRCRYHE